MSIRPLCTVAVIETWVPMGARHSLEKTSGQARDVETPRLMARFVHLRSGTTTKLPLESGTGLIGAPQVLAPSTFRPELVALMSLTPSGIVKAAERHHGTRMHVCTHATNAKHAGTQRTRRRTCTHITFTLCLTYLFARVFVCMTERACVPPPLCNSYALVIATVGVGTVLIWYLILIWYKCSAVA